MKLVDGMKDEKLGSAEKKLESLKTLQSVLKLVMKRIKILRIRF